MMESIIQSVKAQRENIQGDSAGIPVDVSGDVWDAFDERLDELTWKEDNDGVLLAGDDPRRPSVVAEFRLAGGSVEASLREKDTSPQMWRRYRTLSEPKTSTNPQFD